MEADDFAAQTPVIHGLQFFAAVAMNRHDLTEKLTASRHPELAAA
jgi:hypothetical protein